MPSTTSRLARRDESPTAERHSHIEASSLHLPLWRLLCDAGQKFGILGELRGVDLCEALGTFSAFADDERCDLDDLAVASGGASRVLPGGVEMAVGVGCVACDGGQHGEESVVDGVHGARLRSRAYLALTHGSSARYRLSGAHRAPGRPRSP